MTCFQNLTEVRVVMGSEQWPGALVAVAQRLVELAERDARLRAALRGLAESFLEATEVPPPPDAPSLEPPRDEPMASPPTTAVEPPSPRRSAEADIVPDETARVVPEPMPVPPRPARPPAPVPDEPARPLPELTLGQSRPPQPPAPRPATAWTASTADDELDDIRARCLLKAEGMRWASERRRLQAEGADFRVEIAPGDREILDRARALPDCFLWMNAPAFVLPDDPARVEDVARGFEALAEATSLVKDMAGDVESNRPTFELALDLMAEAQSALRVAVDRVAGTRDTDQYRAYDWLRDVAARERIFIRRFMRLDDPAAPAGLAALRTRIKALTARTQEARRGVKRRKSGLGKLRYHAKLISQGDGGEADWRKVAEAVDDLVTDGTPPSSVAIREELLPILDDMPELGDVPRNFALALREIDQFLANRTDEPTAPAPRAPTAEVKEVARRLAGKSAVLIGGVRRPDAHAALMAEFGLDDLIWSETREHESIDVFEPSIAKPSVAVVLLAIRWSSHSFGEVKRFCDQYGKPLVRLPGGYNPNQVAVQILAQCSEQLGV